MKLKAPPGVGDPCVAGVTLIARDSLYEVEAEIGALLIECFGFVDAETGARRAAKGQASATGVPSARRRGRPPVKKPDQENT